MADPSTVVDMTVIPPKIIRQGKVTKSMLSMNNVAYMIECQLLHFTKYDRVVVQLSKCSIVSKAIFLLLEKILHVKHVIAFSHL